VVHEPEILRIRYEDLVQDAKSELGTIMHAFDRAAHHEKLKTLQQINLQLFQAQPNRHRWEGASLGSGKN
jgi:hypothetical protein